MLSMKIVNQIILTFLIICIFVTKTKCDHISEEDDYDEDYDEFMDPISIMTNSELTNETVNKTFVLELFAKDSLDDESEEEAEYKSQYDYANDEPDVEHKDKSILMGKLTVSVETKILKNGKQIGPSIVENQTIFLEEDELNEEGIDPVLVLLQENKGDTENKETSVEAKKITHAPIKDGTSKDESKEEKDDEDQASNSTTTDNSEATEDFTPTEKKLTPTKVTEESEEESSTNTTTTTEKSSSIFDFINDLPFMSSAVGIRSSIVNNLILTIPIYIASLFK